jgi:hypothetical protein
MVLVPWVLVLLAINDLGTVYSAVWHRGYHTLNTVCCMGC